MYKRQIEDIESDAFINGSACVPIAASTRPTPEIEDGEVSYFERDISLRDMRDASLNGSAHVPIAACTGPTPEIEDGSIEDGSIEDRSIERSIGDTESDAFINGSACVPIAASARPTPEIEDGEVSYFERDINSRDSREVESAANDATVVKPTGSSSAADVFSAVDNREETTVSWSDIVDREFGPVGETEGDYSVPPRSSGSREQFEFVPRPVRTRRRPAKFDEFEVQYVRVMKRPRCRPSTSKDDVSDRDEASTEEERDERAQSDSDRSPSIERARRESAAVEEGQMLLGSPGSRGLVASMDDHFIKRPTNEDDVDMQIGYGKVEVKSEDEAGSSSEEMRWEPAAISDDGVQTLSLIHI